MPSSSEIRQQFIDFFVKKCGHTFVPSSPVVPHDDPTLLFANAGMNQFKPYFLGTEKPKHLRVVNTQKCIRAGGKHNDLDDVGKDTYHHTFFEMLGNWSFGDYFKKDAITWAWELLTEVWKLDKSRLHVTVFEGDPANGIPRDDEAADIWKSVGVLDGHIHLGNKKDNFWEMGSTGPCGPCTEIHYDKTPDKSGAKLVNGGSDQVIEIWNNVFIQFNRNEDQSLTPLPAKHVDTGMGFERICAVLNGVPSNYDTDVFAPIFDAIQQVTGARAYGGKLDDLTDTAYRVIGDHIRTLTFAITDGASPGNKGRNAVLRSILRRASRYGWQVLGLKEPFLHKLVDTVVSQMGGMFPELTKNPERVRSVIYEEERGFLKTLDKGLKLFEKAAERAAVNRMVVSGKDAFELHTTYGLDIGITRQIAQEQGLSVDEADYKRLWDEFIKKSDAGGKGLVISAVQGELPKTDDSPKYDSAVINAKVVGWVKDNAVVKSGTLVPGDTVGLLLDRTNFYAEQGGQVGDTGVIDKPETGGVEFRVDNTVRLGDAVLHLGVVLSGELAVGDSVQVMQSTFRRIDIMRNHTATHLLNLALRMSLGSHVEQKGSLVDEDKTRFDFSHDKPISPEELRHIEARVNQLVGRDLAVTAVTMPLEQAKAVAGVRAVFGEKYPDPVRVVLIGPHSPEEATQDDSVEFCGGTHVSRTGTIGYFKIASQEGVAKGVRRITAVTGRVAAESLAKITASVDDLSARFQCKPEDLPARVDALQDEIKKLKAQLAKGMAADLTGVVDKMLADAAEVNGTKVVVGRLPGGTTDQVRTQVDRVRQKTPSAFICFIWEDDGKVPVLAALTPDLVKKGLKAGDIVKQVAAVVGGSGGGKPDLAQAGGKDASKIDDAVAKAKELAAGIR
jgi:alanyl-tRNA synthetase